MAWLAPSMPAHLHAHQHHTSTPTQRARQAPLPPPAAAPCSPERSFSATRGAREAGDPGSL